MQVYQLLFLVICGNLLSIYPKKIQIPSSPFLEEEASFSKKKLQNSNSVNAKLLHSLPLKIYTLNMDFVFLLFINLPPNWPLPKHGILFQNGPLLQITRTGSPRLERALTHCVK